MRNRLIAAVAYVAGAALWAWALRAAGRAISKASVPS